MSAIVNLLSLKTTSTLLACVQKLIRKSALTKEVEGRVPSLAALAWQLLAFLCKLVNSKNCLVSLLLLLLLFSSDLEPCVYRPQQLNYSLAPLIRNRTCFENLPMPLTCVSMSPGISEPVSAQRCPSYDLFSLSLSLFVRVSWCISKSIRNGSTSFYLGLHYKLCISYSINSFFFFVSKTLDFELAVL